MITLTLILCALAEPKQCTAITLDVDSMTECSITGGQASAVRFMEQHPGYVLRMWRCSYGKRTDA